MNGKMSERNSGRIGQSDAAGRRQLLQAGIKLFAMQGYAGTSVRDLALEAGVTPPLIKIHFGSKEGLREAIDKYALGWIDGLYHEAFDVEDRPPMEAISEAATRWLSDEPEALMYIRMALMEKTPGSHALFKSLLRITRRIVQTWDEHDMLQEAVDQKWAEIYLIFDMLGPAIIEPFSEEEFGTSMYSRSMVQARNTFLGRLITTGILKSRD